MFQDGASASVDGPFISTDARHKYGGKGLPPKGSSKLKANFSNPLVQKFEKCSVSGGEKCSGGGDCKKGEKVTSKNVSGRSGECKGEKEKSKSVSGASGVVGGEVYSDGGDSVRRCITREKLDALRRHLGDGRGECIV